MPKVNPYISDQSSDFYAATFRSRNAGCEYMLEAWPALYKRTLINLKGRFLVAELNLFLDIFNGTMLTSKIAGQHILAQVVDSIELDGVDKKWDVDGKDLVEKVKSLNLLEGTCLEIWACGFWQINKGSDVEGYIKHLAPDA